MRVIPVGINVLMKPGTMAGSADATALEAGKLLEVLLKELPALKLLLSSAHEVYTATLAGELPRESVAGARSFRVCQKV